jgi:hypothetical protein
MTRPRETPIELIFRKVMRQKMPLSIRSVLLPKPSAAIKRVRLSS